MAGNKALIPGIRSVIDSAYIQPDNDFLIKYLPRYQQYLNLRNKISVHTIDEKGVELFVSLNPHYFDAYEQAGDYYMFKKQYGKAMSCYEKSLGCVIPGEKEINRIKKKLISAKNGT
jgi:tetratricopeptide (TPR) repeat protein